MSKIKIEKNETVIDSHFLGNFNKGRNIIHNMKALGLMYRLFESSSDADKIILCKPIIVFIGAIAEAVLFDFHYRIHTFTREGVEGLSQKVLEAIRGTSSKKDEFWHLIKKCETSEVFGPSSEAIYQSLKDLRLLRNRFHIQDKERSFEEYESDAFNLVRKESAEKTLEYILTHLSQKHGRGAKLKYVEDFVLPWESKL